MKNRKSKEIDQLLRALKQLRLKETAIVNCISKLRKHKSKLKEKESQSPLPRYQLDRDRRKLQGGHKVLFLTTGKFKSTGGTVVQLCESKKHL